jgi:uncharacterized protein (TIGR03083 family)
VDVPAALAAAYRGVTAFVADLNDDGFPRATRCGGWSVQDLLFHLLLDVQRALVVLARPCADRADTDAVSYWRPYGAAAPSAAERHAAYVRRAARAYASPSGLVAQWIDTAEAAVAVVAASNPRATVRTQGHVMTTGDFAQTLVVEATLHLLDLQPAGLVDPPPADALTLTRRTLERLLEAPPPSSWDDVTTALRLTGREPLSADDRAALGVLADRVPVLR